MVDLTVHLPALSSPRTVSWLDPEPSARRSIRPLIARLPDQRLAIEELRADADVLDVAMLARAGDRRARQVFDDAFAVLGSALAPWLARFEASVLVVGGSMAGSWDLVRPPLLGALRQAEPALAGLAVRRAAHPEDSALIGAAVHAWAVDQATAAGSWAKLDGPSDTDTSEPPATDRERTRSVLRSRSTGRIHPRGPLAAPAHRVSSARPNMLRRSNCLRRSN